MKAPTLASFEENQLGNLFYVVAAPYNWSPKFHGALPTLPLDASDYCFPLFFQV